MALPRKGTWGGALESHVEDACFESVVNVGVCWRGNFCGREFRRCTVTIRRVIGVGRYGVRLKSRSSSSDFAHVADVVFVNRCCGSDFW